MKLKCNLLHEENVQVKSQLATCTVHKQAITRLVEKYRKLAENLKDKQHDIATQTDLVCT